MVNYFCRLTGNHYSEELKCPGCHKAWAVEWETEYGDPMPGDFEVRCPDCGKEFSISVEIPQPIYRVLEDQ